jgi:hypothetical protein
VSDSIRRFWERIGRAGEGKYQPAQATAVLAVASVARDSTGAIVSATGTLDGAGEFTVPMQGHSTAPGDFLLVGYPGNQPVGAELAYLRHVASDYGGAGLVAVDANLPAPLFAATPWTTAIVATPGSITATASVFFVAVEARFQPSGYTVSFRVNGGTWRDRTVPHIGGTQECNLGADLPPGASVDVHLRARYSWAASESVPTADQTFTTAQDTSSPGDVTALAVSTATPGLLVITPTATLDTDLFRGYRYEINDAATGTPDIVRESPGPLAIPLPVGTYYIAASPISKAGTLGGRTPATGYQGPYSIVEVPALDTTPPPVPDPPTVTGIIFIGSDYIARAKIRLTLAAYTPPADFEAFVVRIQHVDSGYQWPDIVLAPVEEA